MRNISIALAVGFVGIFVAGCAADTSPEPDQSEAVPPHEAAEEGALESQNANQCRRVGEEYTIRGSRNCTYPCTPNGDACFGSENSICDVYDCGRYGRIKRNCRFVSCRVGYRRAW
jgi:hypothetical protein